MLLPRISTSVGLALLTTTVAGAPPQPVAARVPVEAPTPIDSERTATISARVDRERELARAEFIEAREAFTKLLESALSSEELVDRAGRITVNLQLRKAEERLAEVETRLAEVEAAGRTASDEHRQLREREVAVQAEITRLRGPEAVPKAEDTAAVATQALANRFRTSMGEETAYLADVLDNDELHQRARRMRRIVAASELIGGLRALRENPDDSPKPDAPEPDGPKPGPRGQDAESEKSRIVPAGGTDDSLGGASETPPQLPE